MASAIAKRRPNQKITSEYQCTCYSNGYRVSMHIEIDLFSSVEVVNTDPYTLFIDVAAAVEC